MKDNMVQFIISAVRDVKFTRFLCVGVVNTLFGYSVFAALIFIGLHYTVATLAATILGIFFNFKTLAVLVFKNSRNDLILRFINVYSIIYVLNIGFLRLFTYFTVNLYIAGFLLLGPMSIVSFILNKHYVFRDERSH